MNAHKKMNDIGVAKDMLWFLVLLFFLFILLAFFYYSGIHIIQQYLSQKLITP